MTREEALQYGHLMFSLEEDKESAMCDFITTAIKAIEQEPCGDAISRQAVIEAFWKLNVELRPSAIDAITNMIKDLPPVTPQYTDAEIQKMQDLEFAEIQKAYEIGKAENPNKWIPVSERLPEKNVEVLATTESGYITIAEWFEYDHWFIHEGSSNAHTDELTAWMPLPEPYKASPTGAERSE